MRNKGIKTGDSLGRYLLFETVRIIFRVFLAQMKICSLFDLLDRFLGIFNSLITKDKMINIIVTDTLRTKHFDQLADPHRSKASKLTAVIIT